MKKPDQRVLRQNELKMRLSKEGFACLLVSHIPNIRYLTGFSGSAGVLCIGPNEAVFFTDGRYRDQAGEEIGAAAEIRIVERGAWQEAVETATELAGSNGTVGFEADYLSFSEGRSLAEEGKVPLSGWVEELRVVKAPEEIDAIREAVRIAFDALEEVLARIRVGESELEIASNLERALRARGSEWHPFETIVAGGPRSGLPHARTTERKIVPGDLLLLDFGARVRGYCADVTRTVVVGRRPDERQAEVYELVARAQREAISGLKAGVTGREVDGMARAVLEEAGWGDAFSHSLGHGLGLEVHEEPRLAKTSEAKLRSGSVVTVEPGLYWADWGGVRIEDDVLVLDETGSEVLGDWNTDLRVVGN